MMRIDKKILIFLPLVMSLFLVACSTQQKVNGDKLEVAATIFPLYDLVQQVGGEKINGHLIVPSGASPHTFEPTPKLIKELQKTKLVFKVGHGLDAWTDGLSSSLTQAKLINVDYDIDLRYFEQSNDKHNKDNVDPHYWLSPKNAKQIARNIESYLAEVDPSNKKYYKNNLNIFFDKLDQKNVEWKNKIKKLKNKKIAVFQISGWQADYMDKKLKKNNISPILLNSGIDKGRIKNPEEFEAISVFIGPKIDKSVIDQFKNLKLITTRSTGFDHIDLKECRRRKILISNVPFYGENTVAEHAFALILALSRRIIEANQRVRQGGFSPNGLTGFDLKGKTLGIVGVGHIGQHMARYGYAFGMKVLGVTRLAHPKLEKRLHYRRVNLETCLQESDIVTIHVPLTPQTHHLINLQNIKLMKRGSYLINTARGPIVESEAILWALNHDILAGAGLDVLEEEEIIDDPKALFDQYVSRDDLAELVTAHLLRERPNVIITPHNAFNTHEAIERILATTAANIKAFLKGNKFNSV